MLASCVVATITVYAHKREWKLGDLAVEVTYDNESTPRQVTTSIHLPDGLTAEQISRLERVAEACPVKRALEAGFSFGHEITTPTAVPHTRVERQRRTTSVQSNDEGARSMCRAVKCRTCGKTTWAGCGRHVEQVMASVPASERCPGHPKQQRASSGGPRGRLFARRGGK